VIESNEEGGEGERRRGHACGDEAVLLVFHLAPQELIWFTLEELVFLLPHLCSARVEVIPNLRRYSFTQRMDRVTEVSGATELGP
jgi:hypothetical protein